MLVSKVQGVNPYSVTNLKKANAKTESIGNNNTLNDNKQVSFGTKMNKLKLFILGVASFFSNSCNDMELKSGSFIYEILNPAFENLTIQKKDSAAAIIMDSMYNISLTPKRKINADDFKESLFKERKKSNANNDAWIAVKKEVDNWRSYVRGETRKSSDDDVISTPPALIDAF